MVKKKKTGKQAAGLTVEDYQGVIRYAIGKLEGFVQRTMKADHEYALERRHADERAEERAEERRHDREIAAEERREVREIAREERSRRGATR